MTIKIALFIGLLLVLASAGGLSFNVDGCKAEKYTSWDALYCPCSGGSGNYQYQYEKLPPGWFANKDRIYAPKGKFQSNNIYGARVTVNDKSNNQFLKRSLLFNYDQANNLGKVYDTDFQFDYENKANLDQFINNRFRPNNPNIFIPTNSNTFIPNPSNAFVVNSNNFINNRPQLPINIAPNTRFDPQVVVDNNRNNAVYYTQKANDDDDIRRRQNPYYDNFPTDEQIGKIIQSADSQRIKNVIGNVAQSRLQCKSRSNFLEKLQSKIQDHINIFRSNAQKNRQANFQLQNQIKSLQEYRFKYNQKDIDDVNERIRGYKQQIEQYHRDRSSYQTDCDGSRNFINQYRGQFDRIRNDADNSRNLYEQQRIRVRDYDNIIADLQKKLQDAKNNREESKRNCDNHQSRIDDCNRQINDYNIKFKTHQERINQCDTRPRFTATTLNDLNNKISQCNKQIDGFGRDNRFQNQNKISALQQQIDINTKQAERITLLFTQMQNHQNQFNEAINQQYYGCYQYLPIKNNNDNAPTSAPSSALLAYLKQVYGQAPSQNIRARFSGNVNFRNSNIFSPAWTKVYGIPFSAGYGSNRDINQDQFSCTQSGDNLKIFNGKIVEVTKNVIQVAGKNGQKFTVHLGGCTKIQTFAEQDIPQKGQDIYFKAVQRKDKNNYNGYHVTCY